MSLEADKSVWQNITGGHELFESDLKKSIPEPMLPHLDSEVRSKIKKVGVMSGGERNRVHLARMLQSGGNLILLDEPTNDLDVETLRTLEEALEGFGGCVIAISHDR